MKLFLINSVTQDHDSAYGGVMIAVSKDSPVPELITSCEMTWYKLHFPSVKNVCICAYYRLSIDPNFRSALIRQTKYFSS